MCKVISISNQKGGVGKTTTTINVGASLVRLGKKVLLIDLDPQGNLTMGLGYENPDTIEITIANLLYDKAKGIDIGKYRDVNTHKQSFIFSAHGIDFIPSSIDLSELENILINTMSRENVLKNIIAELKDSYDHILIDCLPSLNILTVNALNASDEVIIPVQAQYFSAKGLELLLRTIANVRANLNPTLTVAGVLITMLDNRSKFQKEVKDIVQSSYGEYIKIFNSQIPLSVKVSENQSKGETIITETNNVVSTAYKNLANEMMSKELVLNG